MATKADFEAAAQAAGSDAITEEQAILNVLVWLVEGYSPDEGRWGWEYVAPGGERDARYSTETEARRAAESVGESLGCETRVREVS